MKKQENVVRKDSGEIARLESTIEKDLVKKRQAMVQDMEPEYKVPAPKSKIR